MDTLVTSAQNRLGTSMLDHFGKPNQLVAWQRLPIDYGTKVSDTAFATPAGLPDQTFDGWKLKHGRDLYMQHCIHCHGVTGDGNGPTAKFLNPRPRDYRQGTYKFTSTAGGVKPSKADLHRILKNGIVGTSMPSFVLLGDFQIDALTEYVRWLSSRGETELQAIAELVGAGADKATMQQEMQGGMSQADAISSIEKTLADEFDSTFEELTKSIAEGWTAAEDPESVIVPTQPWPGYASTESIAKGKELFRSAKANCAKCHGAAGRGDGPETESYVVIPNSKPERTYSERGLHDSWGNPIQPRNLSRGVYRGGRRPLDLYRRIAVGIKGTPMGGFKSVLTEEEIWHVVNYVMSLQFDEKPFDVKNLAAGAVPEAPAAAVASRGQDH